MPSERAQLGQGDAGLPLDQEQRLVVDLVQRAFGPQRRRVRVQLPAGEIEELQPAVELLLAQEQRVGRSSWS